MTSLILGIAFLAYVLGMLSRHFAEDWGSIWEDVAVVSFFVMMLSGLFLLGFGMARVLL